MSRIKLNFRGLSIPEKIARARQIITALTGNAAFPTPNPTLAAGTAAVDSLETAYAEVQTARQVAKTKTSAQGEREDAVDGFMSKLAGYVESVAGENEELIRSAGMDTRAAAGTSSERPSLPAALEASGGDHEGQADLSWDTVSGARSYIIEKCADPPTATGWAHAGVAIKTRATVAALPSGSRQWFRVAAVGTNGQSGWSDPATCIIP